jgi:uncharacterized protein YbcI
MAMSAADAANPSAAGSKSAAISNLTVRLMSQYTGRGPTRARTFINDDMVTVVLQDTLTKGELTLLQHDQAQTVLATRKTFQDVMGPDLVAGVEALMGRKVLAFLSANHVNPDVAVETFMLAPAPDESPRGGAADAPAGPRN